MKVSDQFRASFDYTEAEWSKIEESVHATCTLAKKQRADLRSHLVEEARVYLACATHDRTTHMKWRKVELAFEKLRQTLSDAVETELRCLTECGLGKKGVAKSERCFRDVFGAICEMHDFATFQGGKFGKKSRPEAKMYSNPRMMYEWQILTSWTGLGGKLTRSRDRETQKIGGLLARFFRAVTIPVMGARAPSLETLPDIIARKKRDDAFEKAFCSKLSVEGLVKAIGLAKRDREIHLAELRKTLFTRS
jgi:hypothetical protein